jgi:hypothetical protein
MWAHFPRRRVQLNVVAFDYEKALETALQMAKSKAAKSLPGWCGRDEQADGARN